MSMENLAKVERCFEKFDLPIYPFLFKAAKQQLGNIGTGEMLRLKQQYQSTLNNNVPPDFDPEVFPGMTAIAFVRLRLVNAVIKDFK